MAKSIKNYTSSIPAATSMARIEEMLVEAGARDIHKSYDAAGTCEAMIFVMAVPNIPQPLYFKLPAKVEKCREALWKNYLATGNKGRPIKSPTEEGKANVKRQAAMTAWRLVHDWVELQLTLIQLDQIEPMEAFLPYVYNQDTKQTFFEHAKEKSFKLLTGS